MKKNGRKAGLTLVMQGFAGERAEKATKGLFIIDYHRKGNETCRCYLYRSKMIGFP